MIRILIVEDEALFSMLLKDSLTVSGFSVSGPVFTGEKAVEIVKTDAPDIILIDIQLAEKMNGIEAVSRIREFSDVPVIFMTGYPDDEIINQALLLKPLDYVTKPLVIETLIQTILAYFNGKNS